MNKIIFCDTNKSLLKKVKKVFKEISNKTHCELIVSNSDLLNTKKKYKGALVATASNPDFTMGGGIDGIIKKEYPEQCKDIREFKFTKDLFFTITCDSNLKTDRKIIQRALLGIYFASRKNDIIFTGLGTGIGGLNEDDFISELRKFVSADFGFANFRFANFSSANFRSANFSSADFRSANFGFANFSSADLSSAKIDSIYFTPYKIYPECKFIGWKKAQGKILKLEIKDYTKVSGGLVSRKLRASKVKVLEIQEIDGKKSNVKEIRSDYNKDFVYTTGKIIEEKDYVHSDLVECEKGIHFFITRGEAVNY
jgi:hypothetical protein